MFNVGDKVVYPMYGAGVIQAIEEKEILGHKKKYYILKFPIGSMKVMVPADNVDNIGIRGIINSQEVDRVFQILGGRQTDMPDNWNKRYRANMDKIKSGNIFEIAAVVRNLMIRDRDKGLSAGERKMLNSAKQILISELALVQNVSDEEIEKLIDQSVK
ncbi:MAG TPA: CarD family transcriptional regulator [Clostridiales bacterium]|nr:CarD family transcriptional regulator [Clostridiales bacterium]